MVGRKGPRGCTAPFADLSPDKVEDLDVGEVSWAAEAVASSWQAAANHVESLGDADMDEMDLDVDEQRSTRPPNMEKLQLHCSSSCVLQLQLFAQRLKFELSSETSSVSWSRDL